LAIILRAWRNWVLMQMQALCWARTIRHDNLRLLWKRRGDWVTLRLLGVPLDAEKLPKCWTPSAQPPTKPLMGEGHERVAAFVPSERAR
jgi:hypothetical protein